MGLVFQEFELLDYLNVLENVLLPYRVSPALVLDESARQRADELVEQVGLADKRKLVPPPAVPGRASARGRVSVAGDPAQGAVRGRADRQPRCGQPATRSWTPSSGIPEERRAPLVVVTHDRELRGRFGTVLDLRQLAP